MTEPTRLFECVALHLEKEPLPDMMAAKENGQWKTYSTREINDTIHQLSIGLLRSGISGEDRTEEGMDKVGIVSKNRPEWLMVDAAVQQTGAILTPIYPTIAVSELEFILNDAQVKIIFFNDEDLYKRAGAFLARDLYIRACGGCPALEGTAGDADAGGGETVGRSPGDNKGNGSGNRHLYFGDHGGAKGGNAFAL
jgi:long-subunit acyl-CoA synthetase (AMP-forming)